MGWCVSRFSIEAVCGAISRPGDIVVMARPSYFLAADIFRDWSLECVEIPSGDDQTGIDLDAFEAALVGGLRPRFIYLGMLQQQKLCAAVGCCIV